MDENNNQEPDNSKNNFPNRIVPKISLSRTEAILTGYVLKTLGYIIVGFINWRIMIGFMLYNFGRTLLLRAGII